LLIRTLSGFGSHQTINETIAGKQSIKLDAQLNKKEEKKGDSFFVLNMRNKNEILLLEE